MEHKNYLHKQPPRYDHQTFQTTMSQHSGYIFVPSHTWAHTTPLNPLVSRLPRHVYANKPTALITYSREDTRLLSTIDRIASHQHIPCNSAPMMAGYVSQLIAPKDSNSSMLSSDSKTAIKLAKTGRRRGIKIIELPEGYDSQPQR
jgi:hypothetical protein